MSNAAKVVCWDQNASWAQWLELTNRNEPDLLLRLNDVRITRNLQMVYPKLTRSFALATARMTGPTKDAIQKQVEALGRALTHHLQWYRPAQTFVVRRLPWQCNIPRGYFQ